MSNCKQCPHVVGDITERDCGFPDCVGGWEKALEQAYAELEQARARERQLREALALYADKNNWRGEVIDNHSGEVAVFDWDGDLQDDPWEVAERALANTTAPTDYEKIAEDLGIRVCICADPENCKEPVPGMLCKAQFMTQKATPTEANPVPMRLWCPECGTRHVDEGKWATKTHKTHQCQSCGHEWRPYDYETVGVAPTEAEIHEPLDISDMPMWESHGDPRIDGKKEPSE